MQCDYQDIRDAPGARTTFPAKRSLLIALSNQAPYARPGNSVLRLPIGDVSPEDAKFHSAWRDTLPVVVAAEIALGGPHLV
jgi:hypothetical protein